MSSKPSITSLEIHEKSEPQRPQRGCKPNPRSKICGLVPLWLLACALLLVVVIAIVVPIAVVFSSSKKGTPRSEVLVPLYVYPSPGAWDPLYQAAERHPHLNFTAVINPASGPGSGPEPDGNYTRGISKLNSYANVRTVGYVSTSWTNRNISLALADIKTYSNWATDASVPDLGVRGIFLDEGPTVWTAESQAYLEEVAGVIWGDENFGKGPLIIQNPGVIPDQRFMPSCNLSIVFEETYESYQTRGIDQAITAFQALSKSDRTNMAVVMHSLPATISAKEQATLVKGLRQVAGSIFLTGLSVDYYSSFWDGWGGFVDDVVAK
ncbi:uncharacterized protein L3040_001061 [Drepanopeziza brunnea f. sp. 'multigermtubi']|uniref:Cell surface spherulin 4-like protein n=1 Tax=Marssonina brunnea f. sp. multigermtubi (strain MB_m1) TaxID=1072389 RepID=K1WUY3_MARBU|nr:uncharacterized protein MBM_09482 [Drepanopeziza brunnea f. sp. 'multigermtubi' MB_m1]EKD12448.1 hypothetical protein MBM_09482 [Drepanopeziza brunnea f. sp. 'multigermtubi' MB_m1]KAJ5054797.1 hypothetical protein L3040_001061 [Drepanopeziza brunnea f. sp. 'multigermtubi']